MGAADSSGHKGRFAYRFGYTSHAFEGLSRIARLAGRSGSALIAISIARLYCATQADILDVVSGNLKLLGGPDSRSDAAKVFGNFARTLADYFWLSGRSNDQAASFADVEGMLPGRAGGAILATGHFGFFEFGSLILSRNGYPVSVITQAEPSADLTKWRADYRARWGAETIELGNDAFSSIRAVEALEQGRMTAMLVDRPMGGRSVDVALPGGRIPFSQAPALLSWMTGCPVIPVSVRRTAQGRYVIRTGSEIFADRQLARSAALESCTRQVADALVRDFQQDPLQWYHFIPLTS